MSKKLYTFCRRLIINLELYLEIQELKALGLTEEEIAGWLELSVDEYIAVWEKE